MFAGLEIIAIIGIAVGFLLKADSAVAFGDELDQVENEETNIQPLALLGGVDSFVVDGPHAEGLKLLAGKKNAADGSSRESP